jgi:hypothetical protein
LLYHKIKTWTQVIGLPFQPDTVTVKFVSYSGVANPATKQDSAMFIRSNLVNDIIGCVYDGCAFAPNLVYRLASFSNNDTYIFRLESISGALSTTFNGILCIHLEFTQHEK